MGQFLLAAIECSTDSAAASIAQRLSHVIVEHTDGTLSKWGSLSLSSKNGHWCHVIPNHITNGGIHTKAEALRATEFTNVLHGFLKNEAYFRYAFVDIEVGEFRNYLEIIDVVIPDSVEREDVWKGLILHNDIFERASKLYGHLKKFKRFSRTHVWVPWVEFVGSINY